MKPTLLLRLDGIHYSPNKALSYNPFFTICQGGRGIGKTTNWLIYGMNRFINYNEEFIYIRRYTADVKTFLTTESLTGIYSGLKMRSLAGKGYTYTCENTPVCHLIPLSAADTFKSTRFDNVTTILYDEAIIKQTKSRRYINEEPVELMGFLSTVQRTRTNVRLVLICNNNDIFNPYFSFFNIPKFDGDYYFDSNRSILIERCPINPELLKLEEKTGLYKLTQGTRFAEYHYGNKVLSTKEFEVLPELPRGARFYFTIKMDKQLLRFFTFLNARGSMMIYCTNDSSFSIPAEKNAFYPILDGTQINYYYGDIISKHFIPRMKRWVSLGMMYFNCEETGDYFSWILEEL